MSKAERSQGITSTLSLTNSAATSAKIPFGPASGGNVVIDTLVTGVSITWHGAMNSTDTPGRVYGADGTILAAVTVAATGFYPIPDACFGCPFVVPVLNAGTATIRASLKG